MDKYLFRKIMKDEVIIMFEMILERMRWMDFKGIKQWNVTDYANVYPLAYYEAKRLKDEVYVLENQINKQIVCAGVLMSEDDRWDDDAPALYLHNFVSVYNQEKLGYLFFKHVEALAKSLNKQFFRLDSAIDNEKLEQYYDTLGYQAVGRCVDGAYIGILRQKALINNESLNGE